MKVAQRSQNTPKYQRCRAASFAATPAPSSDFERSVRRRGWRSQLSIDFHPRRPSGREGRDGSVSGGFFLQGQFLLGLGEVLV